MIERFTKLKSIDKLVLVLLISLFITSTLNVILFIRLNEKSMIESNYLILQNRTRILEDYYTVLQGQYSGLVEDYESLRERYNELVKSNADLQRELDDILHHTLRIVLEESKSLSLDPGENTTLVYEISVSGYAEISLTSSGEVYLWVGSSMVDDIYYARIPPFPETTLTINTKVPVSPSLYLFLDNADDVPVEVEFSINLVY